MRLLPPVLVAPPAAPPVSRDEAKAHLRVDHALDDDRIDAAIAGAVGHLDGYTGILGRAIVTQTWRQDFPFWPASRCLRLPLAPVASIVSVTYRPSGGGPAVTVDPEGYRLLSGASDPAVLLPVGFSPALDCDAPDAIAVEFVAGYGAPDDENWPDPRIAALRSALLMIVGDLYRFPDSVALGPASPVPISVTADRLLAPYRRISL